MKKNTVTLIDNSIGKRYEYNILESTRGPSVVDIRSFFADTGMFTYDPGFTSTASCTSSITFIVTTHPPKKHHSHGQPPSKSQIHSDLFFLKYQ